MVHRGHCGIPPPPPLRFIRSPRIALDVARRGQQAVEWALWLTLNVPQAVRFLPRHRHSTKPVRLCVRLASNTQLTLAAHRRWSTDTQGSRERSIAPIWSPRKISACSGSGAGALDIRKCAEPHHYEVSLSRTVACPLGDRRHLYRVPRRVSGQRNSDRCSRAILTRQVLRSKVASRLIRERQPFDKAETTWTIRDVLETLGKLRRVSTRGDLALVEQRANILQDCIKAMTATEMKWFVSLGPSGDDCATVADAHLRSLSQIRLVLKGSLLPLVL